MDGSGYVAGTAKQRSAATERKAISIMAATIRRNSKKLAAGADRLLRRVS
jgi:hypothetical protein